jgi:hypothetical protein
MDAVYLLRNIVGPAKRFARRLNVVGGAVLQSGDGHRVCGSVVGRVLALQIEASVEALPHDTRLVMSDEVFQVTITLP